MWITSSTLIPYLCIVSPCTTLTFHTRNSDSINADSEPTVYARLQLPSIPTGADLLEVISLRYRVSIVMFDFGAGRVLGLHDTEPVTRFYGPWNREQIFLGVYPGSADEDGHDSLH